MIEEQVTEPEAIVESDPNPTPPDPLSSEALDASLDKAFETVETADMAAGPDDVKAGPVKTKEPDKEPKADAQGREHNEDGTFKAKEKKEEKPAAKKPTEATVKPDETPDEKTIKAEELGAKAETFTEPPNRFSSDAKASWKDAPEPVRAEIHRAVTELESGIEKYRADSEAYEPIREFDTMAKQHGTSIKDALVRYTALEKQLTGPNKTEAIAEVLSYAGISAQDFATQILKQAGVSEDMTGDQTAQLEFAGRQDQTVRNLRAEIAGLRQDMGQVTTTVQNQTDAAIAKDVQDFAADHPRFDELSPEITKMLSTGYASDLPDAYEKAERLNPASTPPSVETPKSEDQPKKASLSVTGAPSSGSDPVNRKTPSSAEEAVERSFAALNL